jgi:uncharacterized UPF0160 family protein
MGKPGSSYKQYTTIAVKFKTLRRVLKRWIKGISNLSKRIQNYNDAILVIDKLVEQRQIYITESNFRKIIKMQIKKLLKYMNNYWRQRYTIR